MEPIDLEAVRRENEAIILAYGGRVHPLLGPPDPETPQRDSSAVARRGLVLAAMIQIAFNAPIGFIRDWLVENGLDDDLADSERLILRKADGEAPRQEIIDLSWSVEVIWALVWAGGFIDELPFDEVAEDRLASFFPDFQANEAGTAFLERFDLRPHVELHRMLDLYYRVHWWLRDAGLKGEETGDVCPDVITERRKALEWILDAKLDWDEVELHT